MARYAELEDGRTLEFPDDTPDIVVQETVKRVIAESAPAAPPRPGGLERLGKGTLMGLGDPRMAANQMVTHAGAALGIPGTQEAAGYWDAEQRIREAQHAAQVRGGQKDMDWGRMLGNVAATAPISAALPATPGMGAAIGQGALTGSVLGALNPVNVQPGTNFAAEKAKQAVGGAAGGAVGGAAGNVLGRMISPTVTTEVAALRGQGVKPTPGQLMGGAWKSAEEKMTSVPLVGQAIKAGQTRANEQFNVAAVNRALTPIGRALPKGTIGREAVEYADDALGAAYRSALDAIGPVKLDAPLQQGLNDIYQGLSVLPKERADQFVRIMQNELVNRAKNGTLTPDALKAAESNLGEVARGYARSADYDQRMLGRALENAQGALREMVERQAPAEASAALRAANAGWAAFKRIQRAAGAIGAEDGVFTPAQLQNAVKALDRSKDKAQFAGGSALMQDLSEAGKKVLSNKVPNSGTPERVAAMAALNPGTWPYIAGGIPASLMYTGPGQAGMGLMLAGRQGPGFKAASTLARRTLAPLGAEMAPNMYGLLGE